MVVNLQMNLRNWGVSGGVGFGGTGPAAILGVGLHPPRNAFDLLFTTEASVVPRYRVPTTEGGQANPDCFWGRLYPT